MRWGSVLKKTTAHCPPCRAMVAEGIPRPTTVHCGSAPKEPFPAEACSAAVHGIGQCPKGDIVPYSEWTKEYI